MKKHAVISHCERYRYLLSRQWADEGKTAMFIMLNPSTATAFVDDPTVRRCVDFAKKWGYGCLEIANLFGFRATDPKALNGLSEKEAVGPDNDTLLMSAASKADLVVLACGTGGTRYSREFKVRAMLHKAGIQPHYLKLTKTGMSCHPLYLPSTLQPVPYAANIKPVYL